MNINLLRAIPFAAVLIAAEAHAQTRASSDYTFTTETLDIGGGPAASADYVHIASFATPVGIAEQPAVGCVLKTGYIAQLTEVTGLTINAGSAGMNETTTLQLEARLVVDDATFLAVPAVSVAWSSEAPVSVSASGLATAGAVHDNTSVTIVGEHLGFTAVIFLSVLNILPDNFGSYASDGVDDDWQVQYFGLDNLDARSRLDPDGDGQTNLFEFLAGLNPTDPTSRFRLKLAPVIGRPTWKLAIFSPIVTGRTYTVEYRTSLTNGTWQPLTGARQSDDGNERTVTDPAANTPTKFYRVNVTMP